MSVPLLSTGQPSTLANWRSLIRTVFGENNGAWAYFNQKIAEQGPDEPVLADERQVLLLVVSLVRDGHSDSVTS